MQTFRRSVAEIDTNPKHRPSLRPSQSIVDKKVEQNAKNAQENYNLRQSNCVWFAAAGGFSFLLLILSLSLQNRE